MTDCLGRHWVAVAFGARSGDSGERAKINEGKITKFKELRPSFERNKGKQAGNQRKHHFGENSLRIPSLLAFESWQKVTRKSFELSKATIRVKESRE